MKTILLATDGSPSAAKATEQAIELAAATSATLSVVSVWRMPVYEYGYVPVQYTPELIEAQEEGAANAVRQAVATAAAAGVVATSEVRQGDAADEICEAARAAGADMIVIGAHGWSAVRRILFGSVSTAVLHHAPCPVLVVRGEAKEPVRDALGAGSARAGS